MEQSPSREANRSSASRETTCICGTPQVNYCINKCMPPVSILSQITPVHASPSHFLKIYFNIILPSVPRSSKCFFFQVSPPKPRIHPSCLPYVPHTLPISFFLIWSPKKKTLMSTDYKSSMLCNLLHTPVTLLGMVIMT